MQVIARSGINYPGLWQRKIRSAEITSNAYAEGGESELDTLSHELGVEIYRLEEWRDKALAGMEAGLARREGDPIQEQLDCAMKKIGELAMGSELLRKRCKAKESLWQRRPRR